MNRFAALAERLESVRDAETAARVLADHLSGAPDPERGQALAVLLGQAPSARIGRTVVAALAERLDPELLAISRDIVGDITETVALMWPAPEDARPPPSLSEIVAALDRLAGDRRAQVVQLADWLDALEPAARVALLRLASGQLAGLVAVRVAQAALARLGRPLAEIEAHWHADAAPYAALLAWATGAGPAPSTASPAPFSPLTRLRPCHPDDRAALDPAALAVDQAWDGLRVLAVAKAGARRIFTRRGEDVSARFPELIEALSIEAALEGVIVAHDRDGRRSRATLDARLGRRPRLRGSAAVLIAHDLLTHAGEDLRRLPLRERRARLDTVAREMASNLVSVSSLASGKDWNALDELRRAARTAGAAGLVLKPWNAPYAEAGWIEWKCDLHVARAVLLYVEHGAEAVTATFGAWRGSELVPVARCAIADPDPAAAALDYVAEHRVERFGPVAQVAASADEGLVVELAFASVEPAPRRKAGLTLRDAQLLSLRPNLAPTEAVSVEALAGLL